MEKPRTVAGRGSLTCMFITCGRCGESVEMPESGSAIDPSLARAHVRSHHEPGRYTDINVDLELAELLGKATGQHGGGVAHVGGGWGAPGGSMGVQVF